MGVSGQLHGPAALPRGKSPWYLLDSRLGGPQVGLDAVAEKKISSTARNQIRVAQLVA